jgi:diguanylate cyclase (GGDEF)-like protein/PAS domain S-box-containing protein
MESANDGVALVVDDETPYLSQLSQGLEEAGYRVLLAESGLHALELVRTEVIDIVLLDVMMPVMSGLETLRAIRQSHSPTRLPVLMVTSNERSDDVLEALELGANDYLTKPIELAVALVRIRTHVTTRRAELARRQSEERLAALAAGSEDGLWDWHVESGELFVSTRWKGAMGWGPESGAATLEAWMARVHGDDVSRVRAEFEAHVEGATTRFESEHRVAHQDGTYRWVLVRGQALRSDDGRAVRVAGSLTDVTSHRITDPLTGLPNREVCLIRLGGLLQQCHREPERPFAVVSLDLDHFTLVNDTLGHVAGDQLLTGVANRLARCLRGTDTVSRERRDAAVPMLARCGGDEFTILLEDLSTPDDAVRVAERLLAVLGGPFLIQGKQMCLSASVGVAHMSADTSSAEDVLSEADAALHRAKSLGGRRYEVFDAAVHQDAQRRLRLETDLRWAIERRELLLQFRPVVEIPTGRLTGFAAEATWQRPGLDAVCLDEIRAVAEATGMASAIDRWTLEASCTQLSAWQAHGPELASISLHLQASPALLRQPGMVGEVSAIVAGTSVDPARLTLEVSGRLFESGDESTVRTLNALHGLGMRIGLTEVGTGDAALARLTRFPFSTLTIQRCLVAGDEHCDAAESALGTIGVAKGLKMTTHATGVDTQQQFEQLRDRGIELGRGDLFGAPLYASAAQALLISGWRYTPDLPLTA